MNFLRVTSTLLLLIFVCSTSSCLKNDRNEASFDNGPNIIRGNRRDGLNEYLVPPPRPKAYPVRSGKVVNPSEAPGYFSQLMSWLNPFNYGPSTSTPLKTPAHLESPPQYYGAPPFNLHLASQPEPFLHPPLEPQAGPPIYPPIGIPPSAQHSSLSLAPSFNVHSAPPFRLPPGPSLQVHNPSATFHDMQRGFPSPKNSRGLYISPNKGKHCNLCNKIPWIPMQGDGHHSEKYPSPQQLSNGYLPPSNQGNHDAQYAASHEIRISELSQIFVGQTPFNNVLPHSALHSDSVPPLYKTELFKNPSAIENLGHLKSPPLSVTSLANQEHKNPEINDEHYNTNGNDDLRSIGTEVNQGHVNAISQSHEIEINKEPANHKESFGSSIPDTQFPVSETSFNNFPILKQENDGVLNKPVYHNQGILNSFGSSNYESPNQNEYHEPFNSNSGSNTNLNYLPPDLNPSASFGTSTFHNQESDSLNYQYSDDLSPSGSVVKNSQVTTQPSVSSLAPKRESIHFEESPLLDLTRKGDSQTETQWTTSTSAHTDIGDNTTKTTTDYNLETDNIFFEDSSNFVRSTESYSSSDIQNINSVFGPPTSTTADFSNVNQRVEPSTSNRGYANQQDVSYIPPSGQPGYLWPSLLINTSNLKNESSKNHGSLNHLAQWNNSFSGDINSEKQDDVDSKDTRDTLQRQQNIKRNKQVQVIIPYTSEYTPIPFQQSYGDWSIKTNSEHTQLKKVPSKSESNVDNYLQQESRNNIQVVNQFQSQFNISNSKKLNVQSIRPFLTTAEDLKSTITKANTSIDVRRLQKNIDNWTIQEYSKSTTSSTILPSSLHPYLSPSKKIPTEYLTTTEPSDHINELKDHNESVKTYSLAGFSFNEIEHEGSASSHIETTQPAINVVRINNPKITANDLHDINKSSLEENSTWETHSVSISPLNKERVYVVTPQPILEVPSKNEYENRKGQGKRDHSQRISESVTNDLSNGKNNFSEFEAIEKAYQVLPQAVNNLAVASTGKENIPLWGIMEHEEFATLNLNENDEEAAEDTVDGPVLYSGHSKVARAKR
ncbi:hypothetical protein QLX08_005413 [Tetragonisca angustula]|uniref:Uncharacterized protein n=1 Tax=Tetragonisca angustula TaxID=166442 RepID=A0AAW0ZY33_9HYME